MNMEVYDIAAQVCRDVPILYEHFSKVFVHVYRYISVCSYCSLFLPTKQRFAEELRAHRSPITAIMFWANSQLNRSPVFVDMMRRVRTGCYRTKELQVAPLRTLVSTTAVSG